MNGRKQILGIGIAGLLTAATLGSGFAQEQKKTDDDKPADPDIGENMTDERTLGLLPNPLQKYGSLSRPISAR